VPCPSFQASSQQVLHPKALRLNNHNRSHLKATPLLSFHKATRPNNQVNPNCHLVRQDVRTRNKMQSYS